VVDRKFVLKIRHPEDQLAAVAPLLCAGITTYSPLRHWKVGPGSKVGVVGIGGLGHMGVKLAHAMGAHVVAFTTSDGKRQAALDLGANEVVVSRNADEMKAHANSFDFILNTVAASHSLDAFTSLLKRDGTLVLVGVPEHPHPSPSVANLIFKRRAIAGSLIGGIAETQEMLDFCAEKGIVSDIEMIHAADRRGLRPHGQGRREVPLRDRQQLPRGLIRTAPSPASRGGPRWVALRHQEAKPRRRSTSTASSPTVIQAKRIVPVMVVCLQEASAVARHAKFCKPRFTAPN
jgi:protein-L-isoaspartate O-methyltransferase